MDSEPYEQTLVTQGSDLVTYAARLVRAIRRTHELPAGFRVLSLLDEHGAVGITALAELDRCSQPTMSAAVRDLERSGWVLRRPHPTDARSSEVSLTQAGDAELAAVRRRNGEAIAAWLTGQGRHTSDDLAVAVAVLRDLLAAPDPTPSGRNS